MLSRDSNYPDICWITHAHAAKYASLKGFLGYAMTALRFKKIDHPTRKRANLRPLLEVPLLQKRTLLSRNMNCFQKSQKFKNDFKTV